MSNFKKPLNKYIYLAAILSIISYGVLRAENISKVESEESTTVKDSPTPSASDTEVQNQGERLYIQKLMRVLDEKFQRNKLKIPNNYKVQYYVNRFQRRDKKHYEIWLERSGKYIPTIQKILESYNIPKEIAYLAMIESGFKMTAKSHASALGPWQFIKPTGEKYKLKINPWVDERMDLIKSTHAAAKYLNDLFDIFQSWELALAAYNCGEERTFKAVRANKSRDFWVISKDLPRETRNHIPKFYAALKIAKNPEKYGFKRPIYKSLLDYTAVKVPPQRSLKEIAKAANVDHKTLYKYNPNLVGRSSAPGSDSYLNVPKNYVIKFELNEDKIYALNKLKRPEYDSFYYYYRVRRGDTLNIIAKRHNTSVKKLKKHNKIRGSLIRIGQRLKIVGNSSLYTTNSTEEKYKVQRGDTISVIAERFNVSLRDLKTANNLNSSEIKANEYLIIPFRNSGEKAKVAHKIRKGDTLIKIAKSYQVSVKDIKTWNKLSSSKLIAGKNLVIFK